MSRGKWTKNVGKTEETKVVSAFGHSGAVFVPSAWVGRKVQVRLVAD